jgi:hypothetical protein
LDAKTALRGSLLQAFLQSMVMRYAHTNVGEHAHTIDRLPGGNLGDTLTTEVKTSA